MASKNVVFHIGDKIPTQPDSLSSDCLTIDAVERVNMEPGRKTQINITIKNSSAMGRMATLYALYDPALGVNVQIENPKIYVGPECRTVTYVLIESKMNAYGPCNIMFGVS